MKPLSIQLYTVREYLASQPEHDVLRRIAELGFRGVEPGNVGPSPKAYLKYLRDLGMCASSWFGPFPDPDKVHEVIETALELEVKSVVAGFWTQEFESLDAIKRTADRVNPAVAALAEKGLNLCLHNHWFEFAKIDGRYAMDWLLDLCPGLCLELDIYWAAHFGDNDPASIARDHASLIPLMHVKDGPLVQGQPHVALGDGKIDVPGVVGAADPEWLVLELDEFAGEMWDAVKRSREYLVAQGMVG